MVEQPPRTPWWNHPWAYSTGSGIIAGVVLAVVGELEPLWLVLAVLAAVVVGAAVGAAVWAVRAARQLRKTTEMAASAVKWHFELRSAMQDVTQKLDPLVEQLEERTVESRKSRQELANAIAKVEAELNRGIARATLADTEADAKRKGWDAHWFDGGVRFVRDSEMATVYFHEIDIRKLRDALKLDSVRPG
jgi:hypothetical protein